MGKSYARICEIIYYFSKHFIYKRKKNLRYLQIKLRLSPSALLRVNFIRAEISLGGGGGSRVRSFRQEPGHSSGSKASNTCGQKVVSSINHLPGCLISRFPKKWSRVPKICATLNYPRRQGGSHFSYRLTSPRTKTCRVLFNPLIVSQFGNQVFNATDRDAPKKSIQSH